MLSKYDEGIDGDEKKRDFFKLGNRTRLFIIWLFYLEL
jgi:hypothetical protein